MDLSQEPDTIRLPSDENATDHTLSVWPRRTFMPTAQEQSCPDIIVSVLKKCGLYCFAIKLSFGEKGSAEM